MGGMLIIGGNKNKSKWNKPTEYMSNCVLQVSMPKDSYKDWKYMPNIKTGRIYPTAIDINDKVIVSGGLDIKYTPIGTVEVLDLTNYIFGTYLKEKWQEYSPLPRSSGRIDLVNYENLLLFEGFFRNSSNKNDRYTFAGLYDLGS